MDQEERLFRILELQLNWVKAAESRVPFILPIAAGSLAFLSAIASDAPPQRHWGWLFLILAGAFAASSIVCVAFALTPRIKKTSASLIFFGSIASLNRVDYLTNVQNADGNYYKKDLVNQIHINAEIAKLKYGWIRAATLLLVLSFPFLFVTITSIM